jgi:hypothetical protein
MAHSLTATVAIAPIEHAGWFAVIEVVQLLDLPKTNYPLIRITIHSEIEF